MLAQFLVRYLALRQWGVGVRIEQHLTEKEARRERGGGEGSGEFGSMGGRERTSEQNDYP